MDKIPNILSSFRLLLAPLFLYLFIQEDLWIRGLSLLVFTIAALTDAFDGYLARKHKVESKLGAFLDPLADKFLTFAGFICLPFLDPTQFPWWAIILIVLRDIIVTALRLFASSKNLVMETRSTAKIKTAIQMGYLYVALLFGFLLLLEGGFGDWVRTIFELNIFYWGMVAVAVITVYSGLEYLVMNRAMFKKNPSA
ncbi:MAG TPA: CDP-diacylglycerol--glycerol-3-phosphate 3-phosphatidyltransferase [Balneolaceae bacterium]|nr:CDP-diacylglycerol--glycerol-3-phosphate 3-phosphatidyltransferase [Balneolaceae bacterium]